MRTRPFRIGVVLALVGGMACGALGPDTSTGGQPSCTTDSQCPTGQVCVGMCASPTANVSVEIVPGAPLQPEDFADVITDAGINLRLDPPGGFAISSNLFPVSVTVTGYSLAIPDQPLTYTQSFTAAGDLDARPGTFSLLATPLDGVTPPINLATSSMQADLDTPAMFVDEQLAFPMEQDGGWVPVSGHIRANQLLVAFPQSPPVGPVAFSVQAVHTTDQSIASQTVLANADGGYSFSLVLAAAPADTPISLVVTPTAGIAPSAVFNATLAGLAADAGLELGEGIQTGTVAGLIIDGTGAPVAHANVIIQGVLSSSTHAGSESFTSLIPSTTSDTGNFQASIVYDPSGMDTFKVLVIPPDGSGLANFVGPTFTASGPANTVISVATVTVPQAVAVSGRVLDNNAQPLANAIVSCVADPYLNTGPVPPSKNTQVTTAADGTFQLGLTPGYYDFDFAAPSSMTLPSSGRGPLPIGIAQVGADAGTAAVATTQQLADFQLSSGRTVTGTAVDSVGHALEGALVKVFITSAPATSTMGAPPPPRSVQVSQAQVVAGGTFSVVLPTH